MRELYPEQERVYDESLAKVELVGDLEALTKRLRMLVETPHEVWANDTPEQLINGVTAYVEATGMPPEPENAKPRTSDHYYRHMRATEAHQTLKHGGFILRISAQE